MKSTYSNQTRCKNSGRGQQSSGKRKTQRGSPDLVLSGCGGGGGSRLSPSQGLCRDSIWDVGKAIAALAYMAAILYWIKMVVGEK